MPNTLPIHNSYCDLNDLSTFLKDGKKPCWQEDGSASTIRQLSPLPLSQTCQRKKRSLGQIFLFVEGFITVLLPENLRAYFELSAQAWILYKAPVPRRFFIPALQ
jgi:hypothetical protein